MVQRLSEGFWGAEISWGLGIQRCAEVSREGNMQCDFATYSFEWAANCTGTHVLFNSRHVLGCR